MLALASLADLALSQYGTGWQVDGVSPKGGDSQDDSRSLHRHVEAFTGFGVPESPHWCDCKPSKEKIAEMVKKIKVKVEPVLTTPESIAVFMADLAAALQQPATVPYRREAYVPRNLYEKLHKSKPDCVGSSRRKCDESR